VSIQLQINSITVYYGAILAVSDLSVTVDAGEIVTLIGANGAGKSTVLRCISGLVRPTSGEILFEGQPIHTMAPSAIVRLGIGHAPEGRRVFANMSVHENLELGAYTRTDKRSVREDLDKMLVAFPRLKERIAQSAGTLSGGEQQMLAIARALMGRPRLLLLDEPSLGLAPFLVRDIFAIIREINERGTTILLVEQNAHMALGVANRGYVVDTGSVVMSDLASRLLHDDQVRKAYLGEV
jgi:branched-chain amino acid transport system ATP-binding protein